MITGPDWFGQDVDDLTDQYLKQSEARMDAFLAQLSKTTNAIAANPYSGSKQYGELLGLPGLRHKSFRIGTSEYLVFYNTHNGGTSMRRVLESRSDIVTKLSVLGP